MTELSRDGETENDETESLVATLSLADSAYQLLLVRILDGRLEPGATLSVPALARTLEMGRSPVREAVQRLVYEGIAENALNRGATVTRVRPEDLPDIFEAKEPLEGLAARRAAARMAPSERAELLEMVDRQERILGEPYLSSTLMRLDVEFHHFYAHHSKSTALEDALRLFTTRTHLVVPSMWTQSDNGARNSVIEHREIAEAIAAGDSEAAELAARRHTQNVGSRLVDWLHTAQTSDSAAGRARR